MGSQLLATTYIVTTNNHRAAAAIVSIIVSLAFYVITALGGWGTYKKAGQNGDPAWAAFVPVYNWIVLLRIVGRPKTWAWFLLLLIPSFFLPALGFITSLAFFVVYVIVANDLSKSFGHGPGFTVGLAFIIFPIVIIIFWYILWLGQSVYLGPAGPAGTMALGGYPSQGGYSPPARLPAAGRLSPPRGLRAPAGLSARGPGAATTTASSAGRTGTHTTGSTGIPADRTGAAATTASSAGRTSAGTSSSRTDATALSTSDLQLQPSDPRDSQP